KPGAGSWSWVGILCKKVPSGEATMNLDFSDAAGTGRQAKQRRRALILHEFGHVLGLEHEHRSPKAPILWNKEEVYKDHEGLRDRQWVDNNIFAPLDAGKTNFTAFDEQSIMLYPIKARWTEN